MKISPNFSDQEFFDQDVYQELIKKDIVPKWLLDKNLIDELEALRTWLNKNYSKSYDNISVEITQTENGRNGFETLEGLKKRGSSQFSQHAFGRGADINAYGYKNDNKYLIPPKEVQKFFRSSYNTGGLGCAETFTHRDTRWSDKLVEWNYAK